MIIVENVFSGNFGKRWWEMKFTEIPIEGRG